MLLSVHDVIKGAIQYYDNILLKFTGSKIITNIMWIVVPVLVSWTDRQTNKHVNCKVTIDLGQLRYMRPAGKNSKLLCYTVLLLLPASSAAGLVL